MIKNVKFLSTWALIVTMLLSACNNSNTQNQEVILNDTLKKENPVKPVFTVTAGELCSDFTSNKENALNKYQNNEIILSGMVQMVNTPTNNNESCNYIMLACDNNDSSGMTIKCCLQDADRIKNIKLGDQVTLKTTVAAVEGNTIRCENAILQ
jgi:hypothetical protein